PPCQSLLPSAAPGRSRTAISGGRAYRGSSPSAFAARGTALRHARCQTVIINLTQPWTASLGLNVVRVIIPSLLPLHAIHTLAPLGHPRLRNFSQALPHST